MPQVKNQFRTTVAIPMGLYTYCKIFCERNDIAFTRFTNKLFEKYSRDIKSTDFDTDDKWYSKFSNYRYTIEVSPSVQITMLTGHDRTILGKHIIYARSGQDAFDKFLTEVGVSRINDLTLRLISRDSEIK